MSAPGIPGECKPSIVSSQLSSSFPRGTLWGDWFSRAPYARLCQRDHVYEQYSYLHAYCRVRSPSRSGARKGWTTSGGKLDGKLAGSLCVFWIAGIKKSHSVSHPVTPCHVRSGDT